MALNKIVPFITSYSAAPMMTTSALHFGLTTSRTFDSFVSAPPRNIRRPPNGKLFGRFLIAILNYVIFAALTFANTGGIKRLAD